MGYLTDSYSQTLNGVNNVRFYIQIEKERKCVERILRNSFDNPNISRRI